jgi:hypothetical protein
LDSTNTNQPTKWEGGVKLICLICKFLSLLRELLRILVLVLIGFYAFSDEGLIEPPLKKANATSSKPAPAASEASAPATTPATQLSTSYSLSKGKEIPSTAVATASPPPSERPVSFSVFLDEFLPLSAPESMLD